MLQKLSKAPKMEPANHFLNEPKAQKNSYNYEFMSVTVKMEQELAEHEKLHRGVEAAIELRLKEAID